MTVLMKMYRALLLAPLFLANPLQASELEKELQPLRKMALNDLPPEKFDLVLSLDHCDKVLSYCNTRAFETSMTKTIFPLAELTGQARAYFKEKIQSYNKAPITIYDCGRAKAEDDAETCLKKEKLLKLLRDSFKGGFGYHSIHDLSDLNKSLHKNPYYTNLHLNGFRYQPEDLTAIGSLMKEYQICSLLISDSVFKDGSLADLARGMAPGHRLEKLYLKKTKEGLTEFVAALVDLPALTCVHMSSCGIGEEEHDALIQLISGATHLEELNLSYNPLAEKTIIALLATLKTNQFAGKLNLGGVKFTSSGIDSLADFLASDSPIHDLDIGCCDLVSDTLTTVIKSLYTNKHLTRLKIARNTLDTLEGAQAFGQLLHQNQTLTFIAMDEIKIQAPHMIEIANGLAANKGLTSFNLDNCSFDRDCAVAFSNALISHPSLKSFGIYDCTFKDEVMAVLLGFLATSTPLESLYINETALGQEAARQFQKVMPRNRTLKTLSLSSVGLTDETLATLSSGITSSSGLEEISFWGNDLKNVLPLTHAVWHAKSIKKVAFAHMGTIDYSSALIFAHMMNNKWLDCDMCGYTERQMMDLAKGIFKDKVMELIKPWKTRY